MFSGCSHVDIICDRYFNNNLKNLTKNRRGHGPKLLFFDDTPLTSTFNNFFLKNNGNKELLNLYCADNFQSYQEDAQSFNVTKGELLPEKLPLIPERKKVDSRKNYFVVKI